jgi:hypothetical protein
MAADALDATNNTSTLLRLFEDRALLDVQLEVCGNRIANVRAGCCANKTDIRERRVQLS